MDLNPSEVVCSKCHGTKSMMVDDFYYFKCDKCKGTGKLDWIENIVGKKKHSVDMGIYGGPK
jgi:hypothetical protein